MQMNFLQLVQNAYREFGLTTSVPVSVLNQTGRSADFVRWVNMALEKIHNERVDWKFDWAQGLFDLDSGEDVYDPVTDFGITGGVRHFINRKTSNYNYVTTQGPNGRVFMSFVEWHDFEGMNVPVVNGTQPTIFTIRPDGQVVYYARPRAALKAFHQYQRMPQQLAADADVPRIPDRHHMAIVWKTVMIACEKTGNFARFDTAEEEYTEIHDAMLAEQTPRTSFGGALA